MNFLGAHEWYYGKEKITLTEINKIAEVRHQVKDPDYKKTLEKRLPAAYQEFKDIFSKKQNNTLPSS